MQRIVISVIRIRGHCLNGSRIRDLGNINNGGIKSGHNRHKRSPVIVIYYGHDGEGININLVHKFGIHKNIVIGNGAVSGKCDRKLVVVARYEWSENNELRLTFTAKTDAETVVNLTNHAYFNLNGGGSVLRHYLKLNASEYLPTDETLIPNGESVPVAGTPMDFINPKTIGRDIKKDFTDLNYGKGYDSCWVIDGYMPGQLQEAAELWSKHSGRTLKVYTTQPGIQVYTGNWLEGCPVGKRGRIYHDYCAVALECQHFPDSPNKPEYPSVVLKPGKTFNEAIIFAFGTL